MQIIKSMLRNVWLKKHLFGGAAYLVVIFSLIIGGIYYWQYSSSNIIDQIIHESNLNCNENVPVKARNKYSGEVKEFPNSCVFPRGWEKVNVLASETNFKSSIYKNDDYGFVIGIPSNYKEINYNYNGKTDYVGIYVGEGTNANIMIYPKGGQDLLIPDFDPIENSFSEIRGSKVNIKRWNLADGRVLVRYVFADKVNNWNVCKEVDKPDMSCNRIDLYASSAELSTKLVEAVSSMTFFAPPSAPKTSDIVYYYAADKLHVYNPATSREDVLNLSGVDQFATLRKVNSNQVAYISQDQVSLFDFDSEQSDIIFSKNVENGITFIPDNFVLSPDKTKVAIGYRYGTNSNLADCGTRCQGIKAGVLIVNLSSRLTTASFDLINQATPVRWTENTILLNNWNGGYSAVNESGQAVNSFSVPDDLKAASGSTEYIRIDATKAVDVRNQKDRFGSASYLFVNGKVVYKSSLGGINLVQN
jgi:hypothetical protein